MIDPNYELTEEQQTLIEYIQQGQALQQLKACSGWDILTDTLEALRNQAIDDLVSVQPGDVDRIQAAHAVAYAVSSTINNLRAAVDNAIIRGEKEAPERLQEIDRILRTPQATPYPF